jgi:hypothetical protein
MKRCTKCGEYQPEFEFNKNVRQPDGLKAWCRSCDRAWYEAHRFYHTASVRKNNLR